MNTGRITGPFSNIHFPCKSAVTRCTSAVTPLVDKDNALDIKLSVDMVDRIRIEKTIDTYCVMNLLPKR